MKKLIFSLYCLISMTGCVDKDAREYATRLGDLLNSYQKQMEKRVQTETKFYKDSAADFRDEADLDVHRSLALEREERASEFIASLRETAHAPALAVLHQQLRDYAALDFDTTRRLLERETTAESEYLSGVEDLETKAKTVASLNSALKELAKAPSKTDQLKQLKEFASGVKTEIDRLDCADLKKALDQATQKKNALDAKKKALEAEPEPQKSKDQLQIDKLAKQIAAQGAAITDLNKQRTDRGCTNTPAPAGTDEE